MAAVDPLAHPPATERACQRNRLTHRQRCRASPESRGFEELLAQRRALRCHCLLQERGGLRGPAFEAADESRNVHSKLESCGCNGAEEMPTVDANVSAKLFEFD